MAHEVDAAPASASGWNGRAPRRPSLIRRVLTQPVTSVADVLVPVVVDAVDLNEAVSRVDVNELLQRVDVEVLMSKIDIEALVQRVDVQAVAERLDLNALVARIDVDGLLESVDVNALLQRVDLDALLARVDINALAGRVEVGSLVGRGTEGLLRSLLDLVRRLVVGLDVVVLRLVRPLRRGDGAVAPPLLGAPSGSADQVSGRYAGPVSRLLAFALDAGLIFATFLLAVAALGYLVQLVSGARITRTGGLGWSLALAGWAFLYVWAGLAVAGRTLGKAVVGLRVLAADGSPLPPRRAFLRTLALPFSFVLLGLGLLIGLFHPRHRALHDMVAGTCVVYDWGDRQAEIPAPLTSWLSRQGALQASPVAPTPHPGTASSAPS